jgi:uncharacterized membrane protein
MSIYGTIKMLTSLLLKLSLKWYDSIEMLATFITPCSDMLAVLPLALIAVYLVCMVYFITDSHKELKRAGKLSMEQQRQAERRPP